MTASKHLFYHENLQKCRQKISAVLNARLEGRMWLHVKIKQKDCFSKIAEMREIEKKQEM